MTAITLETIDQRLQAAHASLAQVRELHQAQLLVEGTGDASPEVEALEEEAQSLQRSIARLQVARAAAADAQTRESRAKALAALKSNRARCDKLGPQMTEVAQQLVERILALKPLVDELDALSAERRAVAMQCVHQLAVPDRTQSNWDGLADLAALRRGHVPLAVVAALWRTGLPKVLPLASVGAILPPPQWKGDFDQGDIAEVLGQRMAGDIAKLDANIDRLAGASPGVRPPRS